MYIFIKDEILSVHYFIDAMSANLPGSVVLDTRDPEKYADDIARLDSEIDNTTIVISFNFAGLLTNMGSGDDIYWDKKGALFVTLLMDHPMHFISVLGIRFPTLYIAPCDEQHKRFIEKYMPWHNGRVLFLPHGGEEREPYLNEKRDVDVLFVGTLDSDTDYYSLPIDFLEDSGKTFYEFVENEFWHNPYMQIDIAAEAYCAMYGLAPTHENVLLLCGFAAMCERSILHKQKVALVQAFAAKGITINAHGTYWKEFAHLFPENVRIGEFMSMDECVMRCGHAKIVINIHPHFSYGSHDRVSNAMLNGAVCVTNKSRYLESRFEDGEDIIFIDFNNLEQTADRILQVLSDDGLRCSMKEKAYEKAAADHWSDRVKQLIDKLPAKRGI